MSASDVSENVRANGTTLQSNDDKHTMFTLEDPLIPVSIALASAIILILICLIVSFVFFRIQVVMERKRQEPELLSYYSTVDSYRRQMVWDFEKKEYIRHLLSKVIASSQSQEDSGNTGSISSTLNSSGCGGENSSRGIHITPLSSTYSDIDNMHLDPQISMSPAAYVITRADLDSRRAEKGRAILTYNPREAAITQVRQTLHDNHQKQLRHNYINTPRTNKVSAQYIDSDQEGKGRPTSYASLHESSHVINTGIGLPETRSITSLSDNVFLSDFTATPVEGASGAQSPLTSSHFNMDSADESVRSFYTSAASDFDEGRGVLGAHGKMTVISLSQLSMNIRSCPDSPLFIRQPDDTHMAAISPETETRAAGKRGKGGETPIYDVMPAFSTTILDIVQGEARKRGLVKGSLLNENEMPISPVGGATSQLSSDGFCTSLSQESLDSYHRVGQDVEDDWEMRTCF